MSEEGNRSALRSPVVELTVRTCTRCGHLYVWPAGSRRPGGECPRCRPELTGLAA